MNIPLSPCVPENLVSRDGFSRPVPRQPAHLHTQAESGAYLRDCSRVPRRTHLILDTSNIGASFHDCRPTLGRVVVVCGVLLSRMVVIHQHNNNKKKRIEKKGKKKQVEQKKRKKTGGTDLNPLTVPHRRKSTSYPTQGHCFWIAVMQYMFLCGNRDFVNVAVIITAVPRNRGICNIFTVIFPAGMGQFFSR